MSRGPGKWQRLILDRVAAGEQFYLVDLLPAGYTKAQYNALHRAAVTLYEAGQISWVSYTFGGKTELIGPPGASAPAERPKGYNPGYA